MFVSEEQRPGFFAAYKRAMVSGVSLHLTEKPTNPSPMRADLDFRFVLPLDGTPMERAYTTEHVERIVGAYFDILHEYLDAPPEHFIAYVMEKSRPVNYRGKMKDGIHIVWPHLVTGPAFQHWVRKKILDRSKEIFSGIPLVNLYEDVVDVAIIDRNAWQMYGSTKPDCEPYRVSRMLVGEVNEVDDGADVNREVGGGCTIVDITPPDITAEMQLNFVELFSMRPLGATVTPLHPPKQLELDEYVRCVLPTMDERRKTKLHTQIFGKSINHTKNYTNDEELHLARQLVVECLSQHRAESYEEWIKLGWTLRNIDYRLIDAWTDFSKLSSKYISGQCEKLWDTMRIDTLGMGTLRWWAKLDNDQRYNDILESNVVSLIDKCTNDQAHYDVARVVYAIFKDEYRFTAKDTWYVFTKHKHRWSRTREGLKLRMELSNRVCSEFIKRANFHSHRATLQQQEQAKDLLMKQHSQMMSIAWNLKKSGYKKSVMEECKGLFADEKFEELLDNHTHLLGFENGVYDLRMHEFRGGSPDDYISFCTGRYYHPFDPECLEAKEIDLYFRQVFTNPSVCKYFRDLLILLIDGGIRQEKFYVFTGSGSNAKSRTLELVQKSLGEYYCILPIALLTQKRVASNSAQSELERTKGRRVAVMQEPGEAEKLNTGLMKELSGGDIIQARGLFKEPIEFRPQFKMIMTCNELPEVPGDDGGTWRRIRVIEFKSKFCENPDPTKPHEFPIDQELSDKFERWADVFIAMLIEHHKGTEPKAIKEPMEVRIATESYKKNNDVIGQFADERIEECDDPNTRLQINAIFAEFRSWSNASVAKGKRMPDKNQLRAYFEKLYGHYDARGWRKLRLKEEGDEDSDEE
jgi:P4 family phage/plasmid primase-like protien